MSSRLLAACATLALTAPALAGEAYSLTINQATSTVSYQTSASVPFSGTLIGANDPAQPLNLQTRTKRMQNLFVCGAFGATQNDAINISGSIGASGSSPTPTNVRPSGTFVLGFDPVANTSFARGLNSNLLASGAIGIAATISGFTYQSFCTVNPSCNAPFFTAIPSLPLGSISLTDLLVVQDPGTAVGTLTPAGPDAWDFSIPMSVTATPTGTFSGAPLTLDPQVLPIVFSGRITRTGTTASVTSSLSINLAPPPSTVPTVLPPTPFTLPADSLLCPNINIVLNLTASSTTFTSSNTASIVASGPRIPCPCDVNQSGGISVQDVFDFVGLWFALDPRADFNRIGGVTIQDIFDFLACFFAPPPEC